VEVSGVSKRRFMAYMNRPRGAPPRISSRNQPSRHIGEMRDAFPDFEVRIGRDRKVTWEGTFQPNPSSCSYRIQVVYGLRGRPRVFVLKPGLLSGAPHRWPDGSLCLYWPKEWRWRDSRSIPATIMVWAALWLEYYEIWQVLRVWLGPSSHDEFPEEQ